MTTIELTGKNFESTLTGGGLLCKNLAASAAS